MKNALLLTFALLLMLGNAGQLQAQIASVGSDSMALVDDGSCTWGLCSVCVGDLDGDNVVAVTDVLLLLCAFGTSCL